MDDTNPGGPTFVYFSPIQRRFTKLEEFTRFKCHNADRFAIDMKARQFPCAFGLDSSRPSKADWLLSEERCPIRCDGFNRQRNEKSRIRIAVTSWSAGRPISIPGLPSDDDALSGIGSQQRREGATTVMLRHRDS